MPRRKHRFASGEFYHLFNRSIYRQPIFSKVKDAQIFLQAMRYYTQAVPPIKFSYFRKTPQAFTTNYEDRLVSLISFCIMPNHFHIAVRQEKDDGIQIFMQRLLNSFSHYYQVKNNRVGSLFESNFKNVRVETDEQLLHLSRYHHLNPVTAHIVEHPIAYVYSSYPMYMGRIPSFVDTSYVLSHFSSKEAYERFVLDRKAYQQELDEIKHLLF